MVLFTLVNLVTMALLRDEFIQVIGSGYNGALSLAIFIYCHSVVELLLFMCF
jgi:hypothetical protein